MSPVLLLAASLAAAAEPYHATPEDFAAVQDGIAGTLKVAPELFPRGVETIDIVLYDSTALYVWTRGRYPLPKTGTWREYNIFRTTHGAAPSEREMGRCGAAPAFIHPALAPERRHHFDFTCSPMGAQTAIQKKRGSVYDTRESYLGTIVHEFAHQYMSQELWQIPTVSRLSDIVKTMKTDTDKERILQEAYAIYCELKASRALYPAHYERLSRDFVRPGAQDPHTLGFNAAVELLDKDG